MGAKVIVEEAISSFVSTFIIRSVWMSGLAWTSRYKYWMGNSLSFWKWIKAAKFKGGIFSLLLNITEDLLTL